jgi:hypothetical protein
MKSKQLTKEFCCSQSFCLSGKLFSNVSLEPFQGSKPRKVRFQVFYFTSCTSVYSMPGVPGKGLNSLER